MLHLCYNATSFFIFFKKKFIALNIANLRTIRCAKLNIYIRPMRFILLVFIAFTSIAAYANGTPEPWQVTFQEPASPVMHKINDLHNTLMYIITGITIFVLGLLIYVCVRFSARVNPTPNRFSHNTLVEVIWTAIPVVILIVIAIPSFRLLYYMDKVEEADMTLKVVGYQWYWGYEYPDHGIEEFESRIIPDEELKPGMVRLLEVDNRVVLPVGKNVRVLVTAGDVIHAWAMPALGVKMDAVPGRTNETWVRIDKPGIYRGQCSELCGVLHGFMPIVIEAVPEDEFNRWVEKMKG